MLDQRFYMCSTISCWGTGSFCYCSSDIHDYWVQIKLLKILALLGAGDRHTSENMYSVLMEVLKRSDPGSNIGNAILYECICTITTIVANPRLLEMAAEITSRFLKVR